MYELDISHIAGGKIGRRQSAAKLSAQVTTNQRVLRDLFTWIVLAQDCLFIGKHCYNGGVLSRSIEWFEEAWMLAGEEKNATISQDQVQQFLDHAAKEV